MKLYNKSGIQSIHFAAAVTLSFGKQFTLERVMVYYDRGIILFWRRRRI